MFTPSQLAMMLLWKGCGTVHGDARHSRSQSLRRQWNGWRNVRKQLNCNTLIAFSVVWIGELGACRKFQATR